MHDDHYDGHHSEVMHDALISKVGYSYVLKDGGIDDPLYARPPHTPFNTEWRKNLPKDLPGGEPVVVTNRKYFDSLLDDNNIRLNRDYYTWAPVTERLRQAFRDVYGNDGTHTPISRMKECQTAFVAAAGHSLREWMDQTNRHTIANRKMYRELTQIVTWARVGDLKPR